jgi:hypothetical protein
MFSSDDQGIAFSGRAVAGRAPLTPRQACEVEFGKPMLTSCFSEIEINRLQQKIRSRRGLGFTVGG